MGCQNRLTYWPMARITPKLTMLPPPIQYTPVMYSIVRTICVMVSLESQTVLLM